MDKATAMAANFKSSKGFLDFVRTEQNHGLLSSRWINNDLKPTTPAQRTWTWYHLPLFWAGLAFGTTGWNVASSLIAVGLSWQYALCSCILGSAIAAFAVTALARPGARYHIGYPVGLRAVMGMYGSFVFVCLRLMTGLFWFGIQTYSGANLISTCFLCMFGSSWKNFENTLPLSADITSKQLVCFFVAWIIQMPLLFVHPSKIQWFFTLKGLVMPFATFGLFGWCMAHGKGITTIDNHSLVKSSDDVPLGWAVMAGINTIMGTLASLAVTQSDLSRYCRKPSDAGWLQGLAVFVSKTLVFFLGLAATASIQGAWGKAYWNVWDLLNAILDHYWTASARTAVFVVSLAFYFSAIGSNIGTNTIAFGADLTGLMPRYMTIVRGQILCCFLGIALVPWKILASAQNFVTFLGSMPIFFGPLAAIMITDYFYARRGNIHIVSLYQGEKGAIYWYTFGVNWRGVAAWIGGFVLGLPGLVGRFHPDAVGDAAKNIYRMGWLITFVTSAVLYAVLVTLFPVQVYPARYEGTSRSFEYLGKTDGFFDDEMVVFIEGTVPNDDDDLEKKAAEVTETKI
ncbi:hypothetical protein HRR83_007454 [Exophiala dermatitidis]|uniref:NCS1 family nucleobase:cation symporter-1 n=2 Tax=Exophiala dermatitidis TaxID=5970 RepID=H6C2F2_EXODN|nr:NCS1 family nucleobase:cation symporter-1 [Exophiala dermatitidis NIH/UT8656]KAJ4508512.1 hypothetical protein HRR75_006333 [Exophiala dermatitidis]EHY58730.1 NCS1 family nucleobase:cation symporter-1 [Exophiala dermatitidis NIH/UT8656]KAJ4510428.1 hypothetical protein HRR74_006900 [Exophiala dermatitidis]KAJ4510638.1 hypothetical protein HRR73_006710 [Exophiala dermatitidis]KAJ4535036.1 hypothetical protein HRR76_006938 [Exophiala dermatitidis]